MKKNKVLKIVLIVLGTLVALLAAAVLGVLLYLRSMAASLPETLPDAPADSTQFTLTDDDLKAMSWSSFMLGCIQRRGTGGGGQCSAGGSRFCRFLGELGLPDGEQQCVLFRQEGEHYRHIQLQHCFCRRKTGVLFR